MTFYNKFRNLKRALSSTASHSSITSELDHLDITDSVEVDKNKQMLKCESSTIFLLGDTGEVNESTRELTKILAQKLKETENPQAVVLLGDNFYPAGVSSVRAQKWKLMFDGNGIFNDKSFPLPFYAILGNHDYYGNPAAQIEYTKHSSRWNMPSYWYKSEHEFVDPLGRKTRVLIIYLDTYSLDEGETIDMMGYAVMVRYKTSKAVFKGLRQLPALRKQQMDFLEATLLEAQGKFDYRIVCGHYPIYSKGFHGTSQTLISLLTPMFQKYKVNVYFNGHDHTLQSVFVDNVLYCTAGSSCNLNYALQSSKTLKQNANGYFMSYVPGFGVLNYNKDRLTVSLLDIKGDVLINHVIENESLAEINGQMPAQELGHDVAQKSVPEAKVDSMALQDECQADELSS